MKLDADQIAAVNVRRNAVVSAGAGAGKTSVLTARYLRLVIDERIPVARILTLTFTRKAAAEMYQRIYDALHARADDPFVRDQLAGFDGAMISTLDSFCAAIARNGASRYGVAPGFSVDEQALDLLCEREALAFLTANADDPVIADLIRLNRFDSLWHAGFAVLARDRFLVAGEASLVDRLDEQERFVTSEAARHEAHLRRLVESIFGIDPSAANCIRLAHDAIGGVDLDAVLADPSEQALAPLTGLPLRCGSSRKPEVELYKELVRDLRARTASLHLARETIARWADHRRLAELLDRFRDRVVAAKLESGLLSYQDVVTLAVRILTDDVVLRRYYRERYSAVMIDEFQDNNDEQKRLLYLVSEAADPEGPGVPEPGALDPQKLFFVGDEKQSIYRFRGADVAVFRTLADELAGDADLRLGANYRSEPGLVRFYNELFTRVFADAAEEYEARFAPLRARAATPGVAPTVELWHVEPPDGGDGQYLDTVDTEAFHIARFISRSVAEASLVVRGADGAARPAGYDDFAILMRSSGNQIRLERMLRLFGVPHRSQTVRSLFLEAPVNDLYQALQLAVYPTDRAALAGFLRSPLVGLSDEGLVRLLTAKIPAAEADDAVVLPDPLRPDAAALGLSSDDCRRLGVATARYLELAGLAGSAPITGLLHRIWYDWGYRYHLLRREEYVTYLEYYDFFRELAERYERDGLPAFLDEVRAHIGHNRKLPDVDVIRSDSTGVQVMSIHKAKGLEFPVVIVADTGSPGQTDSVSSAPWYWSEERGLAFNMGRLPDGAVREKPANYLYEYEQEENKLRDRAELKRLLYVAATRAESHLVFSGRPKDDERTLMSLLAASFPAALDALGDDPAAPVAVRIRTLEPVKEAEEQAHRRRTRGRDIAELADRYEQLPVASRKGLPPEIPVTALAAQAAAEAVVAEAADLPPAPVAAGPGEPESPLDAVLIEHDLAAAFGTYCHLCIERGEARGTAQTELARLPAALRAELDRASLNGPELDLFLTHGARLAAGFLQSGLAADLASAGTVEHEVPVLLSLPGVDRLIRGQIDLLAERTADVVVVDFKTDRALEPGHYALQLELYRAMAAAVTGKPVTVLLYALRSAEAIEIPPAPRLLEPAAINGLIARIEVGHQTTRLPP